MALLRVAPLFALLLVPAARGGDICAALTEAEVSAAAGTQLKRSPADPCRFGAGFASVYITMHKGGGAGFAAYAAQAKRDFPDAQPVAGVGSNAIFFSFALAVEYKDDLFVVQTMLGKSIPQKIAIAKAVAGKVMAHL
jgi:hypothetical protein